MNSFLTLRWLLTLALIMVLDSASAATCRVGDTVTNFTFVARKPFTRADGTTVPAGGHQRSNDASILSRGDAVRSYKQRLSLSGSAVVKAR